MAWYVGYCGRTYHVEASFWNLEAMEFHGFVFGRLMGEWRMPLDVISIVLLTRPLSNLRAHTQGGQPRQRKDRMKSKPDRHDGREGGKLDDPALAVARYDELALRPPIALLISSGYSDS